MKYVLSIALICLMLSVYAQNEWRLLPFGDVLYFQQTMSNEVFGMKADSLYVDSSEQRAFNLMNYVQENSSPFGNELYDWAYNGGSSLHFQSFLYSDSLITIEVSSTHGDFLLPGIKRAGDSIMFNASFLVYFDSIESTEIYGELDSMIVYKLLKTDGTQTPLRIELSKTFGLLSFPHWKELDTAFNSNSDFQVFRQIGYLSDATERGMVIQNSNGFIEYEVGDRFLFEVEFARPFVPFDVPDPCTGYRLYEVISIDSIDNKKVMFNVTNYQSDLIKGSFCGHDFENSTELVPWNFFNTEFIPGMEKYNDWFVESRLNASANDTILEMSNYGNAFEPYPDQDYRMSQLNLGLGITHYSKTSMFSLVTTLDLVAAKTSAGTYGDWPDKLGIDVSKSIATRVYPNPNNGSFYLNNETIDRIEIYDLQGRLTLVETSNTIADARLPAGVYALKAYTGKELKLQEKLIVR